MVVDCKIARPLRSVNGVFSSRAEALGLQRRLRNCFRTLEGEQGPVTHIQSSLSMCMSGRACACSLVSVRVYVCARGLLVCVCVCTRICRENVSTVAGFRHFCPTDIYVSVGFYEDLTPRGCLGSAFSRCLRTNGNISGIILSSMSVVA